MSSPEVAPDAEDRDSLVAAVLRATADLAAGRAAYGARVAERQGLAGTDVEVLRLLAEDGAMTVGRIGELTALTTGATTRMVDRLEQAGFVRRIPDAADRRRVIVEPVAERASAVVDAFAPLEAAGRAALAALDTMTLDGLRTYLVACVAATDFDASEPDGADTAPIGDASVGAPVASAVAGRLVFVTGAPAVTIRGAADLGAELYRARFRGAIPSARVRDGIVTICYPRFAWFDWRARVGDQLLSASAHWKRDTTEIVLNAGLPWFVDMRGATSVTADLRGVRLSGFDLRGGAGNLVLALGHPVGAVRIRVRGGVSDIAVTRPSDVPAVLAMRGGYREATLDGDAVWTSGRTAGRISTPGAEAAADRFEIEVSGGANKVIVRSA